jgi:hypothetical protein
MVFWVSANQLALVFEQLCDFQGTPMGKIMVFVHSAAFFSYLVPFPLVLLAEKKMKGGLEKDGEGMDER